MFIANGEKVVPRSVGAQCIVEEKEISRSWSEVVLSAPGSINIFIPPGLQKKPGFVKRTMPKTKFTNESSFSRRDQAAFHELIECAFKAAPSSCQPTTLRHTLG